MTPQERLHKIESYGNAHALLVEALSEFPKEMWQFRDVHGCWSIHEHIVHITDSEANSYIRCRRLIAEQGEPLMAYDENVWASSLNYHDQSIEDALMLFRWLRHKSYTLIKSLPAIVRDALVYHLDPPCDCARVKDRLAFVGSEESAPGRRLPAKDSQFLKT